MTGWSVRSYVCSGAPFANNPTLLFCPDSVPAMIDGDTVRSAEKALREKAFEEFADIVRSTASPKALKNLMPSAVASGDIASVKLLITKGADPDQSAVDSPYRDYFGGGSALVIAAERGDMAMVKFLLQQGANIDGAAADRAETSPLGMAAREGNVELAQYLLAEGARPDGSLSRQALEEAWTRAMPMIMVGEKYITPFYQAMYCLENPLMAWPHRNTRNCRQIAVLLIQRGATVIGGRDINELIYRTSGEDREKSVSLLLAIAARNGRWDDMVARLMEATGPLWVQRGLTRPNPNADFQPYVVNAAQCGPRRMVAKVDHYVFCQGAADRP